MSEIQNMKIESTFLGVEDHGIFTYSVRLSTGGSGQSFGGYRLDSWDKKLNRSVGTAFGCAAIMALIEVVGASDWESLPGKYVSVEREKAYGPIQRIGHITDDKWLDLGSLVNEYNPAAGVLK